MAKQASRLLLYKRDASPPSCAVMMLADMLGLQFQYKEPDLLKLENKSAEFKKINPIGTIPVLQDGDLIVSESHAIMTYLLNKYGGAHSDRLYPQDVRTRARIDQCLYFDAGVLFNRLKVVALPTLLQGLPGPSADNIDDIEDSYSVIEAYLQQHLYIATDHLTIADLSVGSTTTALQAIHRLDKNKFPRSTEWVARLRQEQCFKKINDPGVVLFTKLMHSFWEKNKNLEGFFD